MKKIATTMFYTYIMEFRGGTYVSQVKADSLKDSILAWILEIEKVIDGIMYLGIKTVFEIKEMFSNDKIEEPSLLTGLKNVWYLGIYTRVGVLRINIVNTAL
jgi:hypothetical protein